MKQEILMLLAKIRYAVGDYQGALDRLDELSLDSLPLADISSRKMKLIGECFAIKGLHFVKCSEREILFTHCRFCFESDRISAQLTFPPLQ